ncbi:MAG: PAS domain S-box protein, partial [Cyanobacteria bacterium P01_H01_bin.119]
TTTAINTDISDCQQAKLALQTSQQKYKELVENANDLIYVRQLDGTITYASPQVQSILGYAPKELLGTITFDIAHPDDLPKIRQEIDHVIATAKPYAGSLVRARRKDGSWCWLRINYAPMLDEQGQVTALQAVARDDSDRVAAEDALRQSQMELQLIADSVPGGIAYVDAQQRYRFVNRTYERWFDHDRSGLVGQTVPDALGDMAYITAQADIERALAGENVHTELYLQSEEGSDRHILADLVPDKTDQGTVKGYYVLVTDISDRKQLELALKNSEASLARVLDSANASILEYDYFPDGSWQYQYFSAGSEALLGYAASEFMADTYLWQSRVVPEDWETKFLHNLKKISTETPFKLEYRFRHKNGSIRWISSYSVPRLHESGDFWTVTVVDVDITERKQLELAVQQSQQQLKSVLDTAVAGIIRLRFYPDTSIQYDYISPYCEQNFGYTAAELKPNADLWQSRIHPDDWQNSVLPVMESIVEQQETYAVYAMEYRFHRKDESICWILGKCFVQRMPEENYWSVTIVDTDISDRKQAELALRRSEAKYKGLISALPDLMMRVNRQGIYLEVWASARSKTWKNQQTQNFRSLQNLEGTSVVVSLPPDLVEQRMAAIDQALGTRQIQVYEQTLPSTGGQARIEEVRVVAYELDEVLIVVRDITQRKQFETDLRLAKEVAEDAARAKTTFIANISHELRSPLNAILGFAQVLQQHFPQADESWQYVNTIYRNGEYLLTLINQLLDLSRLEAKRVSLNPTVVRIDRLIQDVQLLFQLRTEAKGLHFTLDCSPALPCAIRADDTKLRQVLINLLDNAVKFTEQGNITLGVSAIPAKSSSQGTKIQLQFSISDTGLGVPLKDQSDLFEPFAQTEAGKDAGGSGLGLAICREFVALMGGSITVESQVGQGSRFMFDIQAEVVDAIAPTNQTPAIPARVVGLRAEQGTYRILLVDDSLINRRLLKRILAIPGFEIREAKNGQDAIAQWQDWQPHVIWMDLRMPKFDGYTAMGYIRQAERQQEDAATSPDVSRALIVAISATDSPEQIAAARAAGCDDFVSKPFKVQKLFAVLQHHLGLQYIYE